MRGYREDPDRAVFRGDFLHTGDLGFFHADRNGNNYYFISGRIKETIKRYGMTISLREIDDILAGFPEPGFDAISIGFPNDWSGEEVGVVVSQSPAWNDEAGPRLAEYLERQLPPHLRPKAICLTRRPIRTASGKPCRWPFAGQFERYRMATIGQGVRFQTDSAVPRPEPGEGGH